MREHAVGRVAVVGVGREHRAQLAHAGGGLGAVAHHVADHEQHAAVLERVRDVEVAADVAPAGAGEIARGELDARHVRDLGREQGALQREREPPLGAVEHRVVERDARPRGEFDQHAPVERAADRVQDDDRAEHAAPGHEREREGGAGAEALVELARLAVLHRARGERGGRDRAAAQGFVDAGDVRDAEAAARRSASSPCPPGRG